MADNDDWGDLEDELTPEEIAEIERSLQDARMGFTYEMVDSDEFAFAFKCNKCGRMADLHERPFPHKLNCPMRRLGEED